MPRIERKLPKAYKLTAILTGAFLVIAIGFYAFVLSPLEESYQSLADEVTTEQAKLAKSEWETSPSALENAQRMYTVAIGTKKSPATREASDALFNNVATKNLVTAVENVKKASENSYITAEGKKTYSDKYDETLKNLKLGRIELSPMVFGMGRASEGNFYYMTLKLIMAQEIVELLKKNHLEILRTSGTYLPETDQFDSAYTTQKNIKKIHVSDLETLPVKSYALQPALPPCLLEVSVRAAVRGRLKDFGAFVQALREKDKCYTLSHLEIQTSKPVLRPGAHRPQLIDSQENNDELRIDQMVIRFTCTGFALPEKNPALVPAATKRPTKTEEPLEVVDKPIGI